MGITKLPDDVLLDIFFLNTNIFLNDDCVPSTLSSSQVCADWRSLLLSTPSIWGRLMSIQELMMLNDEGREQILSRLNSALLWISYKGELMPDDRGESLLTSILTSNWERIEHLFVSLLSEAGQLQGLLELLELPAPYLRSFYLNDRITTEPPQEQDLRFFDDFAPSLHSFSSTRLPLNLSVKWLRQLTHLTVHNYAALSKVLTCLRSTPQLESLYVHGLRDQIIRDDPGQPPAGILPKLTSVQIRDMDIHNCTVLLRNIQPAKGCSVQFCPLSKHRRINADDHLLSWASEAIPLLSAHLKGFLQVHQRDICSAGLRIGLRSFTFECGTAEAKPPNRGNPVAGQVGILVSIWGKEGRTFSEATHALLPTLFSNYDWSSVTNLTLDVKLVFPSVDRLTAHNLLSFSSVTHLSVHSSTFPTLLELTEKYYSERPVFPLLHTLTVFSCWESLHPAPPAAGVSPDPAVRFLEYRESIGFPVHQADLHRNRGAPLEPWDVGGKDRGGICQRRRDGDDDGHE